MHVGLSGFKVGITQVRAETPTPLFFTSTKQDTQEGPLNLAHVVYFNVKPCLHINTSDMKPEPLPIRTGQEHGAECVDTSLFISAGFYLTVME